MIRTGSQLSVRKESLWLATTPQTYYPQLPAGLTVDVAIVGGGIAGLTAARLLKQAGKTVAVLEADRIAESVSGYTTAKITSLHTLIYDQLIHQFGQEKARVYADVNQAAIEQIAALVQERGIACDFERTFMCTYTQNPDEAKMITNEFKAALKLGLPVSMPRDLPLSFQVEAAVRMENQAQFHPRKYLLGLAKDIPGQGSHIFEKTRALNLESGEPCLVITDQGNLMAYDVIVASHFPFYDPALFFARLFQYRAYALAFRLNEQAPEGMYISPQPTRSIRRCRDESGELLVISGEGHKTGQVVDTEACYQRLEEWTRQRFNVKALAYRWSTQDIWTSDKLPFIGKISPISKNVYVATGFKGWGMTLGTVAGMVLRDLLIGQENKAIALFSPNRLSLQGASTFIKETINTASHLVSGLVSTPPVKEIQPGEGRIVSGKKGRLAVYCDDQGQLHAVSPYCAHMGCLVNWNQGEKSWDCPCHGSRYTCDGKVIQGPAQRDLDPRDIDDL